jgi:arylsulfatase
MIVHRLFRSVGVAALVAGTALACGAEPIAQARPNVLVILADDLGFSDLASYGGEIDTPNLDRLAADGLRFTQGYNTARCWPTRAALLTGYYPQAIRRDSLPGGEGGVGGTRPEWAKLLPQRLAAAGYRSYHSGKWHIDGDPREQGFARSLDVLGAGQSNYFDPGGVTEDGAAIAAGADFYTTTTIGDHAVECLAEHARDHVGTPFFHYVAFTAPHFPLQAPAEVVAKYRERYLVGWDAVRAAREERLRESGIVTSPPADPEPEIGPPAQPKPDTLAVLGPGELDRPRPWDALTPEQREFQATKMAIHAAMVDVMDREVGRIVAQLEAMGALDNTLVVFLSDNGASAEILIRGEGHDPAAPPGSRKTFLCLGPGWSSCSNTPFRRHKMWTHEGGIATPWIVHWPAGIAARGELRRQPVHAIDLVPTVLELARVPEEEAQSAPPLHGRSFVGALADAAAPPAHESLWWCHNGHRAVRVGDWKLVASWNKPWELYHLATDRCETRNLAAAQPDRAARLEQEWNRIAAECRRLAPAETQPATPPPAAAAVPGRPAGIERSARPLAGRRPNIIYVMTDDQGYGDVATHGNRVIQTPNLDRLRDQSLRLSEFHVSPTCAPTRAALLTGRHEFRSGVTHTIFERERLAQDAVTLPQLLRRTAGYTTGIFGKWHLGDEDAYQPEKRGFDRVFIHGGGGIGQSFPGSCGDAPGNTYFDPAIRSDGQFVRTKGYCTDVFFDAALDWIDRCRQEQKPFFCYLTPNCPHSPYDCPPGSDEKYLGPLERAGIEDPKQRATIARFYAMIENIDANMGRLLAKLDEWGLAEETLVVFSTDNGTAAGAAVANDGMRGHKGSPHRGGTRVPAFWRWPGTLPAGVDVPAVTAHIDVLPTLCELAGATIPPTIAAKVEGRSLLPLLEDTEAMWPDRLLVTHVGRWERGKAAESALRNCRIREGRWQLVNTKNRPEAWELYDLAADPGETQDVSAEHPAVVARLTEAYAAWWASVQGDLVNEDLDGPAENPFKVAFRAQFGPAATAAP